MAVDLFSADLFRVTETELYAAVIEFTRCNHPANDRTREGYTIDFKEKWSDRALRVVAAFANTFGGIIVVGVSEEGGRARELVGEDSKGELKTRLAGSIAASITPTPSFEIAECALPAGPNRRLSLRLGFAPRTEFISSPRRTPQYTFATRTRRSLRAAELRSLIARERDTSNSSTDYIDQNRVGNLLPITKARRAEGGQGHGLNQRMAADSVLGVDRARSNMQSSSGLRHRVDVP